MNIDRPRRGDSGLALVRDLRNVCPRVRVVLLTAHASEEYIRAGLDCKADGYVLKDAGHAELMTAIRTVATMPITTAAAPALPAELVARLTEFAPSVLPALIGFHEAAWAAARYPRPHQGQHRHARQDANDGGVACVNGIEAGERCVRRSQAA